MDFLILCFSVIVLTSGLGFIMLKFGKVEKPKPKDKDERALFERMTRAQERVADAVEKQQQGKAGQFLTMFATIVTAGGALSIVDMVIKWFRGG
jgi:hypothetical protein